MFFNVWQNLFKIPGIILCSISTAATLTENVNEDVLNAEQIEKKLEKPFN